MKMEVIHPSNQSPDTDIWLVERNKWQSIRAICTNQDTKILTSDWSRVIDQWEQVQYYFLVIFLRIEDWKMIYNQSFQHGFEVIYIDNIVGPCYCWVWVLECWKFFTDLLTYVSTWSWQQFLIWGHFILRPEAAWNSLRSCELQTKYNL